MLLFLVSFNDTNTCSVIVLNPCLPLEAQINQLVSEMQRTETKNGKNK